MIGFRADIKSHLGCKHPNYAIALVAVPKLFCPLDRIKIKQINIVFFYCAFPVLLCLPNVYWSSSEYIYM